MKGSVAETSWISSARLLQANVHPPVVPLFCALQMASYKPDAMNELTPCQQLFFHPMHHGFSVYYPIHKLKLSFPTCCAACSPVRCNLLILQLSSSSLETVRSISWSSANSLRLPIMNIGLQLSKLYWAYPTLATVTAIGSLCFNAGWVAVGGAHPFGRHYWIFWRPAELGSSSALHTT